MTTFSTRQNRGIGVTFPLMNGGSFKSSTTRKEQVKTNILNVILTEPGERIFLPDFGCGLKSLLFENNVDTTQIKDIIQQQLSRYVPQIAVEELTANTDGHQLKITLSYRVVGGFDSIEINMNTPTQDGVSGLNLSDGITID